MTAAPVILFSSFEPSGDALAGDTIATLRRDHPNLRVYGLGGPRMEAAGAEMLERTTHRGSMFLATLGQAWSHRRRLQRLRDWLRTHRITALVPVDSPAANWSICRAVRETQPDARIVHLVAPQIWAWASWRVRRLHRWSDHVLCLLPFEQPWLVDRGVPATYVGHPAFDPDESADASPAGLPGGHPRLAVLPGSRTGEIRRNAPTMLRAFRRLHARDEDLRGVVAALDERSGALIREIADRAGGWPRGLDLAIGRTPAVLEWCDVALVASGTVTLQTAARRKPMVAMYNMRRLTMLIAGAVVHTRTFTLPNLVSEWMGMGRAVLELVPHHGQVAPVVAGVRELLENDDAARRQREALEEVAARFCTRHFREDAPRELMCRISGSPT